MLKVKKFLGCCCEIECFLTALSWINIVVLSIIVISGIFGYGKIVDGVTSSCDDQYQTGQCDTIIKWATIGVFLFIAIMFLMLLPHALFIRGVGVRNGCFVLPMVIITGIGALFGVIAFFVGNPLIIIYDLPYSLIFTVTIDAVIRIYFFFCYFSVYTNIKDETFNGVAVYKTRA